ncbi:MAG TPA: DnaJ C-terminal domain-containing protein, partial [Chitinophagales bacterium]|nr:DnaJ C-terminal domain-containing protein [Chitinophagales bacterium]
QRGSNLRIKVKLNLEEISNGVQKKIKVKKHITCDTCNGSGAKDSSSYQTCTTCHGQGAVRKVTNTFLGQMATTQTCSTCQGEGKIITAKCTKCRGEGRAYGEEIVTIDIPAGVTEGIQLSMNGKGNAGLRGGPAGDLLLNIEEIEHPELKREDMDVIHELYLNIADAALGVSVEVPTITGKAKIKIPKGTQSGKLFRLQGKGIPNINGYGKGDQIIKVQVYTPTDLTPKEEELLEELKESANFNPGKVKEKKGSSGFFSFFK